jgi:hypothetical protein
MIFFRFACGRVAAAGKTEGNVYVPFKPRFTPAAKLCRRCAAGTRSSKILPNTWSRCNARIEYTVGNVTFERISAAKTYDTKLAIAKSNRGWEDERYSKKICCGS